MKDLKYYIHTFGCQMNQSDSERFSTVVESLGYQPTETWQQADLIVFNTCSVRQKAEDRVLGMGPQIIQLKEQNQNLKIILSGCMARRTWQGKQQVKTPTQMSAVERELELKQVMPWVDVVLETKDFGKLPQRLGYYSEANSHQTLAEVGGAEHYLSFKPKYRNNFQAFVPISTGCDHFCTYCIVPFSRGSEVCRSAESIIAEVFNLVHSGYKDITLLGQTVNRWVNPKFDAEIKKGMIANTKIPELNTHPLSDTALAEWATLFQSVNFEIDSSWVAQHTSALELPKDFLQLIQVLDQIPGTWWTTWVSSHPNYMTEQLVKFIGESSTAGHQKPYLHFALQSGSDTILKRMNRRYTYAEFFNVVNLMRQHISSLAISTDIIVGFPKETEADFQLTAQALRECAFDQAFISEYSPRKGTASALLKDDVSWETKTHWKEHLNDKVLAPVAAAHNQQFVGREEVVLVEGKGNRGTLTARTRHNKVVRIENSDDEKLVGQFVKVQIIASTSWALAGVLS